VTVTCVDRDVPKPELVKLQRFRIWFHDGQGVLVDAADEDEASEIALDVAGRRCSSIAFVERVEEQERAEGE
jgi:hypothetical protein